MTHKIKRNIHNNKKRNSFLYIYTYGWLGSWVAYFQSAPLIVFWPKVKSFPQLNGQASLAKVMLQQWYFFDKRQKKLYRMQCKLYSLLTEKCWIEMWLDILLDGNLIRYHLLDYLWVSLVLIAQNLYIFRDKKNWDHLKSTVHVLHLPSINNYHMVKSYMHSPMSVTVTLLLHHIYNPAEFILNHPIYSNLFTLEFLCAWKWKEGEWKTFQPVYNIQQCKATNESTLLTQNPNFQNNPVEELC